MITTFKVI